MNITTKFDVGDEVYWIGDDGMLYMGTVQGFVVNFAEALLYRVASYMCRPARAVGIWEPDSWECCSADEFMESELFATEEELFSKGHKLLLKKQIRNKEKALKELRAQLVKLNHELALTMDAIKTKTEVIVETDRAVEKIKKELEDENKA